MEVKIEQLQASDDERTSEQLRQSTLINEMCQAFGCGSLVARVWAPAILLAYEQQRGDGFA